MDSQRPRFSRRRRLVAAILALAPAARASTQGHCQSLYVPVSFPGVPGAQVYGELCMPDGPAPAVVQFLVHGSTFNHFYWDWSLDPKKYSHVDQALADGYATFNIDRLGTGLSTKPASTLITADLMTSTLHQIIVGLKSGAIGGHAFPKVVYFGSSLSTVYGWLLARDYPGDVDAFVLTGLIHFTRPTWLQRVFMWHVDPACTDPKFYRDGLDCGYITTTPGKRDQFFWYVPEVSNANLVLDELLKDVVSFTLVFDSARYVIPPVDVASSPSQAITVPTLIALGQYDNTACGDDGLACSDETVRAFEAPYYSHAPVLDAYVPAGTGHALPLHYSGEETTRFINAWIDAHL